MYSEKEQQLIDLIESMLEDLDGHGCEQIGVYEDELEIIKNER